MVIPLDPQIKDPFLGSSWALKEETMVSLNDSISSAKETGSPIVNLFDAKSQAYPVSVNAAIQLQQSLQTLIQSGFSGGVAAIKQTAEFDVGAEITW